jgi:hypothetical protein
LGLSHSPSLVMNGLVLCLDAGNTKSYPGSGTTWTDLSGKSGAMTLTNGPTYSSADGGYILFNGVNQWARTTSTGLGTGNRPHSLEMWVNFTTITSTSRWWLAVIGTYESVGQLHWIGVNATNTAFGVWSGATVQPNLLGANRWLHIVTTFNGTLLSSYVNSVAGPTTNATFNITSSTFTIGLETAQSAEDYYSGKVSIARIYNRALTAAEVSQNFNALRGRYGI